MLRRDVVRGAPAWAAAAGLAMSSGQALAQGAADTLRIVVGEGQDSLDPHGFAVNAATLGIAWMTHDRLVGFGTTQQPDGSRSYDTGSIVPQLAERWQVAPDGRSIMLRLQDAALHHDGTPVTAADVKWSLDRAVANPGPAAALLEAGFSRAEQFVVIDTLTLRIDLPVYNPAALAALALVQASVLNATLCRRHATADDPWALAWVKTNPVGGGAYRINTWSPRTETVLVRNDAWLGGALPAFRRVLIREAPSTGNRRAMLQRGEADLAPDLPVQDVVALAKEPTLRALGGPLANTLYLLGMNTRQAPFDDVRVRQAVAHIVPYQAILDRALQGRGRMLWGGGPPSAAVPAWPQAFPYRTDPDRARALLKAAGLESGFETTLSYDLATGAVDEPAATLLQEALRTLNVSVAIDRRPAGALPALIAQQELGFYLLQFGAWFNRPEYVFARLYGAAPPGPDNGSGYANATMNRLIRTAQTSEDQGDRNAARQQMIALAMRDVPYVPLAQPMQNVAAQRSVRGFVTMFERQVDARVLSRG